MNRIYFAGLVMLSMLHLPAAEIVFPEKEWQTATPDSQGVNAKQLETAMSYLDKFCSKQGNSQAMVIRNGYVIWKGDDTDNVHHIWSCAKSVMSMSFGLCWDDGLVTPETYAKEFWPAMAKDFPDVQLKHIGSFQSGINWTKENPYVLGEPLHKPGTHYHYGHAQPNALAYICTKAAGKTMKDLFTERIAGPIQMNPEMWSWGSEKHPDGTEVNGGAGRPGFGVAMNAQTMARLGWLLANKGKWNGKQILSEKFVDYATHSHWDPSKTKPYDEKAWYTHVHGAYGFMFWCNGIRPDGVRMWPHATKNTFALQGNRNNICIVVPEWNLVLVRLGTDKNINVDLYDGVLMTLKDAMKIRDF